ncbi:valine--tRNA ligase [Niabella soli]|uniref:Valine--tRNA ligase n=1 Tax=Niabella soli DSM 19437 TaxID=929713 RepID=W0EWQ7_9BACT|nr:valine--tRNA ligase [Niabella soli]AHF15235.1 valyl-tRNA synthetase [Niabella soli DSM 19437]
MELTKNFEPAAIEIRWTDHWKEKGYFNSTPDERPAFTVVIPPPNVTGVLHMGHTLNETVQDILVRRARMSGYNACWVPGSDHASIATEAKVVQMLKEKGIDKNTLTREEFLKYAFEWKEKYGGIIYNQIERLGCSVDWNRVNFTMDDHYYKAVIKVFVDLYNKGLIYRGARMINWDPAAKTALSDEEVEYREVQSKLYYIQYKLDSESVAEKMKGKTGLESSLTNRRAVPSNELESFSHTSETTPADTKVPKIIDFDILANNVTDSTSDQFITIATTRPETILGDTAICVNPNDERYQHLKDAYAFVPLINRRIPIIFDEYVDMEFGTGALKITPAHDINDYNLGLKHNLEVIDTLNEDGTLSEAAQLYVGEDRFEVRKKIVIDLEKSGNLVKTEDIINKNGFSQRSNAVVEPRISTQWFVKMKPLAEPALKAVVDGDIKIHPGDRFLATYKYWLENVKDWCISRQLWWGQQIPAWYAPDGTFVVAENKEEAFSQWSKVNSESANSIGHSPFIIDDFKQDSDVLDTWFSSWLWPSEVFHGITNPGNPDINYYYPTSVLVTGQDIIFFWVARMVMAGLEYEKEIPFKDVYFTGMVRDKLGRKMSKSLGNSPDLLNLIDTYGADAVRFGIMIAAPAGNDLLFDESSLEQGRNFNNKMWNALKLIRMWQNNPNGISAATGNEPDAAAAWMKHRIAAAKAEMESLFKEFRLSEGLKTLYSLIWDDFCSWYLEWQKPAFGAPTSQAKLQATIGFFEELLQLLHPYMPFITEEIYHLLREQKDDLSVKQYATTAPADDAILAQGELLKQTITAIRDARVKNNIKPKEAVTLFVQTAQPQIYSNLASILQRQANVDAVSITEAAVDKCINVMVGKDKLFIQPATELDTSIQKEQLEKDLQYLQGFLVSVDKKLSNERFVQNAKPEVVEIERRKKADAEEKIKAIEESLKNL